MDGPKPQDGERRRSGTRVLVADDHQDTARMIRILLRGQGYDVRVAFTGQEAIEVAEGFRPEAILLDHNFHEMEGDELATRLRGEGCCRDATIIASSGYGQEQDRRRSKESGVNHHLIKHVDFDRVSPFWQGWRLPATSD
ncbi:response regulator [Tautonia plasticadhaerens]|uniref:Transcriptional regulatory protein SrrA n=1 Tax=Tautonia plasticadhaerens TaxID=2527974 RepID=A0A518HDN1_9BACT|nr:response regulator [Tautonia plasticadhaerens]QDV38959.1 Transcriptional regulatory protein SrrA [Tautonia plasticadhaerens]